VNIEIDRNMPILDPEKPVNTRTERMYIGPLYSPGSRVVEIWRGTEPDTGVPILWTEFGEVTNSYGIAISHEVGGSRPCVHYMQPPPRLQVFSEAGIRSLDANLRVRAWPNAIASFCDGELTLACDVLGTFEECHNTPQSDVSQIPQENRWGYRLYPIKWRGVDTVGLEPVVLGVRVK